MHNCVVTVCSTASVYDRHIALGSSAVPEMDWAPEGVYAGL